MDSTAWGQGEAAASSDAGPSATASYTAEPLAMVLFLMAAIVLANVMLLIRWAFVRASHPPLKAWIQARFANKKLPAPAPAPDAAAGTSAHSGVDNDSLAHQVLIEAWEGMGALLLQIWSLHVMFVHNGGCTILDTTTCLKGWPQAQKPAAGTWTVLQALWCVKWAWYCHNSLKHRWGLGPNKGLDNLLHHSSTLVLVTLAFYVNVMRAALLALVIFNFTNPLLNGSRACNMMHMKNAKKIVFLAFTVVFFVARVVCVPLVVFKVTVPAFWTMPGLHVGVTLTINLLLVFLYLLSVYWFKRIVDIAVAAFSPPKGQGLKSRTTEPELLSEPLSPISEDSSTDDMRTASAAAAGANAVLPTATRLPAVPVGSSEGLPPKNVASAIKKVL